MAGSLLDVNQVASKLNLTPQQVRNLCRANKIKNQKISGVWLIEENEVNNYYANNCCGKTINQSNNYDETEIKDKPIALSFLVVQWEWTSA